MFYLVLDVLCTFVVLSVNVDCIEIPWRLQLILPGTDKFGTKTEMKLVYNDLNEKGDVTWNLPKDCEIRQHPKFNLTSHEIMFTCTSHGWHTFGADINGVAKGSRDVVILDSYTNFYWRTVLVGISDCEYSYEMRKYYHEDHVHEIKNHVEHRHRQIRYKEAKLRIWIVLPSTMGHGEWTDKCSAVLTRQYNSIGMKPIVSFENSEYFSLFDTTISSDGLLTDSGFWEYNVTFPDHVLVIAEVSGQSLSIFDSFVGNTKTFLTAPKFNDLPRQKPQASFTYLYQFTKVVQDPCIPTVLLALNSQGLYITEDSFNSMKQLTLPPGAVVKAAAVTYNCIYVVMDSSLYRLDISSGVWKKEDISVIGVKARDSCSKSPRDYIDNVMIVSWSDHILYVHNLHGKNNALPVKLPQTELEKNGITVTSYTHTVMNAFIKDAAFDVGSFVVAICISVLHNSGKQQKLVLTYNLHTEKWHVPKLWLESDLDDLHTRFLPGVKSNFLFWDKHSVYYYYDEGLKYGTCTLLGCRHQETRNELHVLTAADDYITQVLMNNLNEVVIMTHKRNMYYGKLKYDRIVQIYSGESTQSLDQDVILYFDAVGHLYLVKIEGGDIKSKNWFPLQQEVSNALGQELKCPYVNLLHNVRNVMYYLDMGEEVKFWATVVYPSSFPNSVEVAISSDDSSEIEFYDFQSSWEDVKEHINDFFLFSTSENKTFSFKVDKDFLLEADYEQALIDHSKTYRFEVVPAVTNLACPPVSNHASVTIGCPLNRYLSVRKKLSDMDCEPFYNYTIPGGWYVDENGNVGVEEKVFSYDFESLGCPFVLKTIDIFLPELEIFDSMSSTRQVKEDFILWEEHSRKGWTYNATMKDAGCHCEAASRDKYKKTSNETNPLRILGPHNYVSCFKPCTEPGNLNQPYEILNASGVSGIKFTKQVDGIYIFNILVVDPNFSFCSMTTHVGVRVTDAFGRPPLPVIGITLFSFIIYVMTILAISYMYFRRMMMKEFQTKALLRVVLAYQQSEAASGSWGADEDNEDAATTSDGTPKGPECHKHEGDFISKSRADKMHPIKESLDHA